MTNKTSKLDTESIKRANAALDFFDRVRSTGWKGIFDGALKVSFMVILALFIAFLFNPKPAIEYYMDLSSKIQNEQHQELIDLRVKNTPQINNELQMLQLDLGVDASFIIEFHNGNNNMAALPFWWGDMTYEATKVGVASIRDNWMNISLTRYTFLSSLIESNYWSGDISDIAALDEGFYRKLYADQIKYVAFYLLYNLNGKPLGVLGVADYEGHEDTKVEHAKVVRTLSKYTQIINPLLIGR